MGVCISVDIIISFGSKCRREEAARQRLHKTRACGSAEQWRRELSSSHAIGQALSSTVLLAARSAVTQHLAVNGEALVGRRM